MRILVEDISFTSSGNKIVGYLYRPEKTEKSLPAVVLCHGYPGDTKNLDVAEALAFEGYAALIFYYQGAWGSEGTYSLTKLEENARDAIEYVLSLPFVDSRRLAMIGHSMGAVPVSKTVSSDRRIKTAVFLSPATDFRKFVSSKTRRKHLSYLLRLGRGKLAGLNREGLVKDLRWVYENSNPVDVVKKVSIPILVVVGSKDDVTTPRSCKRLYSVAKEPKEYREIPGADHAYYRHRTVLIDVILSWLKVRLQSEQSLPSKSGTHSGLWQKYVDRH
ncbi:MAG: alpha/beta hydrolase [Nitrososphaeria archaeon]